VKPCAKRQIGLRAPVIPTVRLEDERVPEHSRVTVDHVGAEQQLLAWTEAIAANLDLPGGGSAQHPCWRVQPERFEDDLRYKICIMPRDAAALRLDPEISGH
jgi:hypothetical protein